MIKSAHSESATCPYSVASAVPPSCPVSHRGADFDPFGVAYQQDPAEYLLWAREEQPVFFSPKIGYWVVTRYDDIKAIFRDHFTFSPSIALEKITPTSEEANAVLATYGYAMNRTLVNEDEPAHMARRRLLMEPFTPDALRHHEPMVRQLTREYVDRFINDGRADLVDQMLWEVPLTVALHFLGVPEEDMATLRKYSIAHTVNTWGRPRPDEQVEVAHAVGNFWKFAGAVLEKMRLNPEEPGWMRFGIQMQAKYPDVVTDSYLHSMMMAGIVAAHETTANAAANALKLLLQNPQSWREICENSDMIPNAVEECLRHSGSVAAWRRLATRDVQVGGVQIPSGSKLLMVMSSANHDERHFSDADLFDIKRENAVDHLTFGYGAHQCMGKNLARMELQIFLEEFTRRLPHMRLAAQEFTYLPNTSFRGPEHLWVEWDPDCNPERLGHSTREVPIAPMRLGSPLKQAATRVVRVEKVVRITPEIVQLRLVDSQGLPLPRWTPGAHIDVECGSAAVTRQYSLCGNPDDLDALEIAVLHEVNGGGGSAWIHANVQVGDELRIRGPRNHFRMDETVDRFIFIAGGIGITPISAMAQRALKLGIPYELHYSGRRRNSMAFLAQLQQMHGECLYVYADDEGVRNDFTTLLAMPDARARIYACGPTPMLAAIEQACESWPEGSLCIEHFSGKASALDPALEYAFEVELQDSGLTLHVPPDRTVLEVLRSANVDVRSDCEEGLCGSCEVRVLEGRVDHRDVVLTRSERDANDRMMACCSRAYGGKLVLQI